MTGPGGPADPRAVVDTELERVVRRWHQLPLDRALPAVPALAALVQHLADEGQVALGERPAPVPDLGPAALLDQLRVVVHDYAEAGLSLTDLAAALTALRRSLP